MIKDGSFEEVFNKCNGLNISILNLEKRQKIELKNDSVNFQLIK